MHESYKIFEVETLLMTEKVLVGSLLRRLDCSPKACFTGVTVFVPLLMPFPLLNISLPSLSSY